MRQLVGNGNSKLKNRKMRVKQNTCNDTENNNAIANQRKIGPNNQRERERGGGEIIYKMTLDVITRELKST